MSLKRSLYILVAMMLFATPFITANTQDEPQQPLEEEYAEPGTLYINMDSSAMSALSQLAEQRIDEESGIAVIPQRDGYRIGIFFSNSSSARAGAQEVVALCDSLYGDIPITMSYDNPYFKVSAGYCVEHEEAIMLLNRLQQSFPKAYIMRGRFSPQKLVESREKEIAEAERVKAEFLTDSLNNLTESPQ